MFPRVQAGFRGEVLSCCLLRFSALDTLDTFWDNITESVHLLGLMNSATKLLPCAPRDMAPSLEPIA